MKTVLVIAVFIAATATSVAAQTATGRAWYSSTPGDSVVYAIAVFDNKLKASNPGWSQVASAAFGSTQEQSLVAQGIRPLNQSLLGKEAEV